MNKIVIFCLFILSGCTHRPFRDKVNDQVLNCTKELTNEGAHLEESYSVCNDIYREFYK